MKSYHLKIYAYNKIFYNGPAVSVTVPAPDGEYQILYDHENYVFGIVPGLIRYRLEDGTVVKAICGPGFVEVFADDEVEVMVDTIELPEEIDLVRAQEAKERAEEQLRQHQSQLEYHSSQAALSKAMARLKEASKYNKKI